MTAFRGRKIFLALLLLVLGWGKGLLSRLKIALQPCGHPMRPGEGAFYDAVAAATGTVFRC